MAYGSWRANENVSGRDRQEVKRMLPRRIFFKDRCDTPNKRRLASSFRASTPRTALLLVLAPLNKRFARDWTFEMFNSWSNFADAKFVALREEIELDSFRNRTAE